MSARGNPTLLVGAHYGCFGCLRRGVSPRCSRCGEPAVDLRTDEATGPLQKSVLGAQARPGPAPAESPATRRLRWISYPLAGAAGLFGAALALKLETAGLVPKQLVALCGLILGIGAAYMFISGMVFAVLVLATILATAVAATACAGTLVAVPFVAVLRGREGVSRAGKALGVFVRGVFGPVRALRAEYDPRTVGEDDPRSAGLVLEEPPEAGAGALELEGVASALRDESSLSGDLEGLVVGAAGEVFRAVVRDAWVPSLELRDEHGESVLVHPGVGTFRSSVSPRRVVLGESAPQGWGVPRRPVDPEKRRRFPRAGAVDVWCVPDGVRMRARGGVLRDELVPAETDSYREPRRRRVLEGTPEHPLELTVLDAAERPRAPAKSPDPEAPIAAVSGGDGG